MNMIKVLWGSFKSAWEPLPCGLSKGPLNWDFLHIYLTTLSESLISKMQNLRGSFFSPKYLKFNLDFKNAAKNWEKVFCFWDNCIWIGIVKLSLLRTGYFSSAANVLTTSPKVLHVNKRNFSNSIDLAGISEFHRGALWRRFQNCLGTSARLLVESPLTF